MVHFVVGLYCGFFSSFFYGTQNRGEKKMMYVTLLVATISKYQLVNH